MPATPAARSSGTTACLLASLTCLSCSQIKTLSPADALSPAEKLEYLILAATDRDAARQYASTTTEIGRIEFVRWYWTGRGDSTDRHERLLGRARAAWDFFGSVDLMNDDRVTTYIRFGAPRRDRYEPAPIINDTLRILTNPAETWSYDSLGWQFDFVKTGTAYRLVGETRFGPRWFPPAFEPVDLGRPTPPVQPGARAIDFDVNLYRLGQHDDTVTVELHYGIAATDSAVLPSENQNLLRLDVELTGRHGHKVSRSQWLSCSRSRSTRMVVGREIFALRADIYRVRATTITADGRAMSTRERELDLVNYTRRQQPTSDVLFCSLIDSVFQSPQFQRPDWARVVPLVRHEIPGGGTFYVLYEIYQLATDSANRHRAEVTYELIEEATGQRAVIPTPSRLVSGSGSTGVATERVHTMDMRPGRYLLVSKVRDLNGQRDASVTAAFVILPRRQ